MKPVFPFVFDTTGAVYGGTSASAKLHLIKTAEQLRLGYDASNYCQFTVDTNGDIAIVPSGGDAQLTGAMTFADPSAGRAFKIVPSTTGATHDFIGTNTAAGYSFQNNSGTFATLNATGLGVGTDAASVTLAAKLHGAGTTEQLRLSYNNSVYVQFVVDSSGNIDITPSGDEVTISGDVAIDDWLGTDAITTSTPTGTTQTIDWGNGNTQYLSLASSTGNVTLTLTAPPTKGWCKLRVTQHASTPRTLTWPAAVRWPGGTKVALTASNSAIDWFSFWYDGTNYDYPGADVS